MRQNAYYRNLKRTFEDLSPCLLLRNKDHEYNNPLASFATCLCKQRIGHERTTQLRQTFRGADGHDLP